MVVEKKQGTQFVKHYSNKGLKLRQIETGAVYDEAIDVIPCPYTYEETDERVTEEE